LSVKDLNGNAEKFCRKEDQTSKKAYEITSVGKSIREAHTMTDTSKIDTPEKQDTNAPLGAPSRGRKLTLSPGGERGFTGQRYKSQFQVCARFLDYFMRQL